MRVKQTARKSTATPAPPKPDPLAHRRRVLETKRSSLGSAASSYIRNQGSSSGSSSGPASGLGSRGKHITFKSDVKVKPRLGSGEAALNEIRKLQKSTELLIPKSVFHRCVREITQNLGEGSESLRYQVAALLALQEATEHYMTSLFEDAYLCTIHAKRVTLFTKDMDLCRKLRRL